MLDFFFDIDGTLLPFGKPAPDSAVKAIAMLKEEGHRGIPGYWTESCGSA